MARTAVNLRTIERVAFAAALTVIGASIVAHIATPLPAAGPAPLPLLLLDLDREGNIPTWGSTVGLAACSILAILIAVGGSGGARPSRPWTAAAAILAAMSAEEVVELHERLTAPIRGLLGADGILYYAWVVPAGAAAAAIGIAAAPWVARLEPPLRRRLIVASSIYFAGALGMELLGGLYASSGGRGAIEYWLSATAEESLEIAGIALLLRALLRELAPSGRLEFHFGDGLAPARQAESRADAGTAAGLRVRRRRTLHPFPVARSVRSAPPRPSSVIE